MAITNPDFIYVAKYDIYVQRSTRLFYKRCHRGRKTEITEDELVLMDKFLFSTTDYIRLNTRIDGKTRTVCISYVFAEAFPELVGNAYLHELDPETFCELNHKSHVHNTWESNFPENTEWTTTRINRADTSKRVHDADEKRAERLRKKREYNRKRRSDPEYLAKQREREAAYRRKQYQETRPLRKQQSEQLAAQLQASQQIATLLSDVQVRNKLEELLRKQQAGENHQLADT